MTTDVFDSSVCAERLKSISEPHRLRIIEVLAGGEFSIGDIAEFLEIELVLASHHVKILKQAGIVTVRREGRYKYCKLAEGVLVKGRNLQSVNLGCCVLAVPPPDRK